MKSFWTSVQSLSIAFVCAVEEACKECAEISYFDIDLKNMTLWFYALITWLAMRSVRKKTGIRPKKIPVVSVSYREKIRVGRSEIIFLGEYFFHGFFNN